MSEGRNIPRAGEEPVLHGGALDDARAEFPGAAEPWIDLSTGINPIAYPVPKIGDEVWARLPCAVDERALVEAAVARYGVRDGDDVVVAPGTQALIQALPRLVSSCDVAIVGPTYGEHEVCWRRAGHRVSVVAGVEAAVASGARVVVVVNPNNPTGRVCSCAQLAQAAEALAARDGLLVVDEAFVDLMARGASLVGVRPDNAVVLRSFGKTYGLAGVRLGFAIAEGAMAARLRSELGPWCVSGPALEIGARALGDTAWLNETRKRLLDDVARLSALLEVNGFSVIGATPLFVLGSHAQALQIRDRLGQVGIHVRHFPEHPTWLRFGIPGGDSAWQRLRDAL